MTRSRIQKRKFFIFLLFFLLAQTAIGDGALRRRRDATAGGDKVEETVVRKDGQQDTISLPDNAKKPADGNRTHDEVTLKPSVAEIAAAANKTVHTTGTSKEHSSEGQTTFNTGALVRGFLVFVGLSILVMAYIVFRSFRLNKTRAQMVRKYGVLTHRQDVEMRPLPLEEEDDEDTTVFDASNVMTNNVQHQNA